MYLRERREWRERGEKEEREKEEREERGERRERKEWREQDIKIRTVYLSSFLKWELRRVSKRSLLPKCNTTESKLFRGH